MQLETSNELGRRPAGPPAPFSAMSDMKSGEIWGGDMIVRLDGRGAPERPYTERPVRPLSAPPPLRRAHPSLSKGWALAFSEEGAESGAELGHAGKCSSSLGWDRAGRFRARQGSFSLGKKKGRMNISNHNVNFSSLFWQFMLLIPTHLPPFPPFSSPHPLCWRTGRAQQ